MAGFFGTFFALLVAYMVYEQLRFRLKAKHLPGPSWVPPLIGNIVPIITNPFKFYKYQDKFGLLSWNALAGMFFIFSSDTSVSRKVLTQNDKFDLFLTLGAKRILGDKHNIAFMSGEPHKLLRRRLLPLFTPRALEVYLPIQENLIRESMPKWIEMCKKEGYISFQPLARDLTIFTSQMVFLGPYINESRRQRISDLYFLANQGMLVFPINLPGFTFYKAINARKELIQILTQIVSEARARHASGGDPECLLDFWMELEAEHAPNTYEDEAIAFHVLDFLFASQDASTSSLVWVMHLLATHPEVLRRVREEQAEARPQDDPFHLEVLSRLPYTQQVVREILRFRPPGISVPVIARTDTPLTDNYVVPKGTVIFPSLLNAQMQGYTEPHKFDPDRFSKERREDEKYPHNWLVFGTGPHLCPGRYYATNQLVAFTALVASHMDWDRLPSDKNEEFEFMPTIIPADGCLVNMRARTVEAQQ